VAFLSVTVALCTVVSKAPVAAYEMSIYDAYPWHFWLATCINLSCGILIILRQALNSKEGSNWWLVGIMVVIMANCIVLLLPFLRGYFLYGRDDPLSHLLMVQDIVSTGKVTDNLYPASHILAAGLSLVCGVDSAVIVNCQPTVFSVVYVVGVCALAVAVGKNRGQVLLISALGTVLLFSNYGTNFRPTHFAFAIVPLILLLFYLRMTSMSNSALFVILLLLVPILHIFASVMVATVFLLYELSFALRNRLSRRGSIRGGIESASLASRRSSSITPALLVLVAAFAWYWDSFEFAANARSLRDFILYDIGARPADTITATASQANTTVTDFLYMFFRGYGHELAYAVMAALAILVVIRKWYRSRIAVTVDEVFFGLLFVVFSLAFFPFLFGSFLFLNPLREFEWALMAATVVVGMVFYEALSPKEEGESEWRPRSKVAFVMLALGLIGSSTIGVFGAYYCPLYGLTNAQVTRAEMSGMQWFFTHSSSETPTINVRYIGEFAWRSLDARPGYDSIVESKNLAFLESPLHFGYQQGGALAPDLSSGVYLVITRSDRLTSSEIWHERGDFTTQDFDRLNSEPALAEVYCNGELEIWVSSSS